MKPVSQIKKSHSFDGILLLDKPTARSSHSVCRQAQRLIEATKAGHTGSLDPLATGMLPLCFGEATKFSRFFLEANKGYAVKMWLGKTTTTGDSEGDVLKERAVPCDIETKIPELTAHFTGSYLQTPPMYSALKHNGQPLYRLARQGKTIEREPRLVTISDLVFDGVDSFTVTCTKGTYIRSLVEDMGEYLGCGAHVIELRRTFVAPFNHYPMVTFETLEGLSLNERREHVMTISTVLSKLMPSLALSDEEGMALLQGRQIPSTFPEFGWVSIHAEDKFLGVGEVVKEGFLTPKRLISMT